MLTAAPVSPANLCEVVTGDQVGYQLRVAYSLELTHGLMGYFPAIVAEEDRTILILEKDLLETVWKMLSPRRSQVNEDLVYANSEGTQAFLVGGRNALSGTPMSLLTRAEFEQLTASGENPFKWTPGLVGDDMSQSEFADTLRAALKECKA